ncbi:hypothetical protein DB44_GA00060, partial [Candidatus Protochlamydia amoebophila]
TSRVVSEVLCHISRVFLHFQKNCPVQRSLCKDYLKRASSDSHDIDPLLGLFFNKA